MVRGRILADRQLLERFGQLDRIVCRFDELEHDVVENRLLAATLQIAFSRVTSPNLHRRIARLRAVLNLSAIRTSSISRPPGSRSAMTA